MHTVYQRIESIYSNASRPTTGGLAEDNSFELIQYVKSKGDALRALSGHLVSSRVLQLDGVLSSVSLPPQDYFGHEVHNLHLSQEFLGSIPATVLNFTSKAASKTGDTALYVQRPCIRGQQVPYAENRYQRPVQVDPRTVKVQDLRNSGRPPLTCLTCYNHEQVAPNCHLALRELPINVANFEALNPGKQASLPVPAYLHEKTELLKMVSWADLAALRHTVSLQVIPSLAQAMVATTAAGISVAVPQESGLVPAMKETFPARTEASQLT